MFTTDYLHARQTKKEFIFARFPASVLTSIAYASVRGKHQEEGAVQRVLNTSRIQGIKEFTLAGGDFPNAIVLNWIGSENQLQLDDSSRKMSFEEVEGSAQIIDGQHRVAGIRAAIKENEQVANIELPVVIYQGLSTKECADIFLSINTEQKPVPRSLVFDLYGIASEDVIDPAALRARDIAMHLNQHQESPYFSEIKLPGSPIRKGGIALSTAVSAIKPLVAEKGFLEQLGINELELQRKIIMNYFSTLQKKYGDSWKNKNNVFLYAAGFMAAIEFLQIKLLPHCNAKKSYTTQTMTEAIKLQDSLIWQQEVKGLSGAEGTRIVYNSLVKCFDFSTNSSAGIEF